MRKFFSCFKKHDFSPELKAAMEKQISASSEDLGSVASFSGEPAAQAYHRRWVSRSSVATSTNPSSFWSAVSQEGLWQAEPDSAAFGVIRDGVLML